MTYLKQTFSHGTIDLEYMILQENKDLDLPVWICFHGFGRSMDDFIEFIPIVDPNQNMISFNLFQHGNSKIDESRHWKSPLKREEIRSFFEAFFEKENIQKINLMGYSMGGKLTLLLCELFSSRIQSMILIAPDGIKISRLYKFSSRTQLGTSFFRHIIKKPQVFFNMINYSYRMGFISRSQRRVMRINLRTEKKRKQVGETWYAFSRLDPDIREIRQLINKHAIRCLLVYGKYDKIIPEIQGHDFIKNIPTAELLIIHQGHALMNYKVVNHIAKKLNNVNSDVEK